MRRRALAMLFVGRQIDQQSIETNGHRSVGDANAGSQLALNRCSVTLQLPLVDSAIAIVVDAAEGTDRYR